MFENKVTKTVLGVYFSALAFMMYYFLDETAYIPLGISYRHIFALCIIVSTFVLFLIKPKINEAIVSVKSGCVFGAPLLVVFVSSMVVWILDMSAVDTINRGLSGWLVFWNMFSFALCATCLLYVFGEDGIWLNLAAMLAANLHMIISVMVKFGVGPYFTEFFDLVFSFADKTGDVIVEAEIHELAFCIGAYLIYMLFKPKKKVWFWILFGLAAFCFLSAFKRIATIAILVALAFRLILLLVEKSKRKVTTVITVIMSVVVLLFIIYIALIKTGVFSELEKAGIFHTMGRTDAYEWADQFYEFSPLFTGKGIGFLTYMLGEQDVLKVSVIHSDFLQYFVDLGFFGYILWLLALTVYRIGYFAKRGNAETAVLTFILTVYLLICSSTDNTVNFPLLTTTLTILVVGNCYNVLVDKQKSLKKLR